MEDNDRSPFPLLNRVIGHRRAVAHRSSLCLRSIPRKHFGMAPKELCLTAIAALYFPGNAVL